MTVGGIMSTQLLTALDANTCNEAPCNAGLVDTTSAAAFESTDGPWRYTKYCLVVQAISMFFCICSTQFLPGSLKECHEWKVRGIAAGNQTKFAYASAIISGVVITVR